MVDSPLVSVIVPNYNYAKYLNLRLESIFAQTYDNYEVILLDDKSSDGSIDIINKYSNHPKVSKVIINEVNSGSPFIQWKRGIKEACGDVIWIAESDDLCSPSFLEKLVGFYLETNSILAFCKSQLIDENGNKKKDNFQMQPLSENMGMDGKAFVKEYLGLRNEIQNASCAIFSREKALAIDDNYMDFKGAGDWLFWIKLSLKGRICFVNEELNSYRLHDNTTSSAVKSGLEFREMKRIYDWLFSQNLLSQTQIMRCRKDSLLLICSLSEIPQKTKNDLFRMWNASLCYKLYIKMVVVYLRIKNVRVWLRKKIRR